MPWQWTSLVARTVFLLLYTKIAHDIRLGEKSYWLGLLLLICRIFSPTPIFNNAVFLGAVRKIHRLWLFKHALISVHILSFLLLFFYFSIRCRTLNFRIFRWIEGTGEYRAPYVIYKFSNKTRNAIVPELLMPEKTKLLLFSIRDLWFSTILRALSSRVSPLGSFSPEIFDDLVLKKNFWNFWSIRQLEENSQKGELRNEINKVNYLGRPFFKPRYD